LESSLINHFRGKTKPGIEEIKSLWAKEDVQKLKLSGYIGILRETGRLQIQLPSVVISDIEKGLVHASKRGKNRSRIFFRALDEFRISKLTPSTEYLKASEECIVTSIYQVPPFEIAGFYRSFSSFRYAASDETYRALANQLMRSSIPTPVLANVISHLGKVVGHPEMLEYNRFLDHQVVSRLAQFTNEELIHILNALTARDQVPHHLFIKQLEDRLMHSKCTVWVRNSAVWSLGKLNVKPSPLFLQHLESELTKYSGDGWKFQYAYNILRACAKHGRVPEPESLRHFEQHVLVDFSRVQTKHLTIVLWAYGKFRVAPGFEFLEQSEAMISRDCHELPPIRIANILWAYGVLELDPPRSLTSAFQTRLIASDINPNTFAILTWAFGKIGIVLSPEYVYFQEKQLRAQMSRFTAHNISNIMWSLGRLHIVPSSELLASLETNIQKLEPDPKQLSHILWAYARFPKLPSPECIDFLDAKMLERIGDYQIQTLSNTLWSFVKLLFIPSKELCNAFDNRVIQRGHVALPQEISNITWCFGKMGIHPSPECYGVLCQHMIAHADEFDSQQITEMLQAFLAWQTPPPVELRQAFETRLMKETEIPPSIAATILNVYRSLKLVPSNEFSESLNYDK